MGFCVRFDTEAAFWAFVLLLTSMDNAQVHSLFQRSGMRYHEYRDQQAAISPMDLDERPITPLDLDERPVTPLDLDERPAVTGPMQRWTREQTLLAGIFFGLLPLYLKLALLLSVLYFSAV